MDELLKLKLELRVLELKKSEFVIEMRDILLNSTDTTTSAYHALVKYADPAFGYDHWIEHEKRIKEAKQNLL